MTEAERLANQLDVALNQQEPEDNVILVARWYVEDSAAELRRLSSINAELVDVLTRLHSQIKKDTLVNFDVNNIEKLGDLLEKAKQ
jgi:hypothetical protein